MWNQVRTRSYVARRATSTTASDTPPFAASPSPSDSDNGVGSALDEDNNVSLENSDNMSSASSDAYTDIVPSEVAEMVEMICTFKAALADAAEERREHELSDDEDDGMHEELAERSGSDVSGSTRMEAAAPDLAHLAMPTPTGVPASALSERIRQLMLSAARSHPRHKAHDEPRHPEAAQARALWQTVANEAEVCYTAAGACVSALDRRGVALIFAAIADGIVSQTRQLLVGVLDDRKLAVWGGIRAARAAVLADTVRTAMASEDVEAAEPYAVIVVADAAMEGERGRTERAALEGWMQVCEGLAQCVRVAVDAAPAAVRATANAIAACGGVKPVLVVMHAAADSAVSSAAKGIRQMCNQHGVSLCLDGGAIAMAAQHGRTQLMEDSLAAAHTLILQPAAWLGCPAPAAVTCSYEDSGVLATHDPDHYAALPAALAHWWIFSRLGAARIRAVVADAAAAAETLAHRVAHIPGLQAELCGIGAAVRLTYVPESAQSAAAAAAAPGAAAGTAKAHVARINQALQGETARECRALGARGLAFAPGRCLAALWAPPAATVDTLIGALDAAVRRVRICAAARAAFNAAARGADGIEAAADAGPRDVLTFASFRVVPSIYADGWSGGERQRKVHRWTTDAFESLDDAFADLADGDRRFARKVDKVVKMRAPYMSLLARVVGSKGTQTERVMPFQAFLHQDEREVRPAWIALVPTPEAKIDDAEIAAELAAELVAVAADRVLAKLDAV